ncbi:MAG: AMP-binding protein, partial [Bacteroidota bacterium]
MDKTKFTGHKFKAHHDFWSSHQSSHAGGFSCKQNAAHGHSSYERREIAISGERASRLERLSKGKDMGYFILILSAVSLLFRKFTNDRHITIHTPCCKFEPAGQDVTIVPLLLKVPDQVSLKEYLNDVKFAVQQCYRYQELPVLNFESPLTDVYASDIYVSFHEIHTISQSEAQYDLTIEIQKWQGEFKLVASFRDGAFTDEFIRWWCEKFEVLADQINDLEQSTASLELLDDDEKQQLLSFGRNEKVFQQTFRRLQEILEHTARQHPHAIALVNEDEHISYDELNRRVGQLSKILKTKYQICSGDRVGILLDNKTDYILAILAVLTAGATYVPVDPLNPVKVIEFILKDASISLLISEDNFISKLTITGQTLIMSRERCDIMNTTSGAGDSHDVVDGAEQAYIIYTSGTSGKPKGVIVSHRGVINTLLGLAQWLPLSEGARFNFTTSFAFDASL